MATRTRRFKDGIYEQVARLGKAVAAPKRLELLELLAQGPRTVEALATQASVSIANASRHLQVLRGARLVDAQKHGLYVEYRLADDDVGRFLLSLRRLAESRLAEIERATRAFFEPSSTLEGVQGDDLLRRVKSGEVTVLDVRPVEEYAAGHIPGALSVPVAELEAQIAPPATRSRRRRLLPWSVLRDGRRGRGTAAQQGLHGAPDGAGRAGLACARLARGERRARTPARQRTGTTR